MEQENGKNLTQVHSPVSDALILICEKCGKKLESKSGDNPARDLQYELKSETKNRYGKGKVRTVLTSCMDICPKDEIAMAIVRVSQSEPEFLTVQGKTKQLCEQVLDRLNLVD